MTDATKPPSLVRKLANVMGAVERVPKTGRNKFHNYDYATESDITSAVREAMADQGVMMIPTVEEIEWTVVETQGGKKEKLATVKWLFTLLDADSDSRIEFRNVGQGQDSGDKAFYKAATGAVKYALLKLFLIPTGDDPEESSPEHGTVVDPRVEATKAAAVAERAAGIQKMVSAFAAIGVDAAALDALAGGPVAAISNDTWAVLRADFKKLDAASKAKPPLDPEEEARQLVRAQAEASLATAEATTPQTKEQMTRALQQSIFARAVEGIRAAKTEAETIALGGGFATLGLPASDLKALQRVYTDRVLVLQDAAREKKSKKMQIKDEVP